jgi:hypothetical protein
MTQPTPVPSPEPEAEAVGIATILGRDIKMKQMTPDQLMAVDMMARRLQRLSEAQKDDKKFTEEEWAKFLNGTRRLLDWVSGQFYDEADLDWFEDKMLFKEVTLQDIGPLLQAMGMPVEDEVKPGRKARRAKT